ncbi:MAG TPA: hypothetical protein DEP53_00800 [Bacteroidetes bacterium]|nr:hypothetical protein [Bacteroidota bacterium]
MLKRSLAVLVILFGPVASLAQQSSRSERVPGSSMERLIEDAMTDGREAYLVDALTRLRDDPLDINSAPVEELGQIPGLDPVLIGRIAEYRSRTAFASLQDLLQIEGVDDALLSSLKPFITVRKTTASASRLSSMVKLRSRLSRSLSDQRAAATHGYLGSAEKVYNRITAKVAEYAGGAHEGQGGGRTGVSMELGILTEKDPGEPHYADFISAHAHVILPSSGIRFILGDFGVDAAHGEVFSSSGSYARRSDALAFGGLTKEGVRPSLASESSENGRGAALSWSRDRISVSLFFSSRRRDATLDSSGAVTSWDADGYHRTEREQSSGDQVRENTLGARARMRLAESLNCGVSWYTLKFNRDVLRPEPEKLRGSETYAAGFDLAYTAGASSLSAEFSQRMGKAQSCVVAFSWSPERSFTASLLVKARGSDGGGSLDLGIGRSSVDTKNDFGVTWAVRFRPATWLRISASYDQFQIPEYSSTNVLPSSGSEMILNAECRPTKSIGLELRYREKVKPAFEVLPTGGGLDRRVDGLTKQIQARASLTLNVLNSVRSRSRLELSDVRPRFGAKMDRGFMMYHECSFDVLPALSISVRGIAFETTSYESRIYEFEEDLPGAFQSPALYGRGFRWFVRGELECGSWLTFSAKYAHSEMRAINQAESEREPLQFCHDERWSLQLDVSW